MADFKEQLRKIRQLREQREQCDQRLYIAQLELSKIENRIRQQTKKETALPEDAAAIQELRSRIAGLEARVQELNRQLDEANDVLARVRENDNRIRLLRNKIAATAANLQEAEMRLQAAGNADPPDRKLIEQLEEQIRRLRNLLQELEPDLAGAEREREILLQQQRQALAQKEKIAAEKRRLQESIAGLQRELAALLHAGESGAQELQARRRQLQEEYRRHKEALAGCRDGLEKGIAGIYADPHPRATLKELNDGIPFLLLPVRIETRFITAKNGAELWLRIYPDDIAVHTHEKLLTDKEVAAGIKYWKELFRAEKAGGEEKEDKKKSAWSAIASLFGPQRSAWVAQQNRPSNWSDDLGGIATEEELLFPPHDQTKTHAWSRAPRTKVLPDKFVVMLYEGNAIVREEIGRLIPDELIVGPEPLEPEESFENKDGKLLFGEAFNWTSDFDKAVQLGMGFKIPLTASQAAQGFDKILVLGLYLSADETESKGLLEELIENHHYSPKGFSLVLQGTPTNNTEQEGSGYTSNDQFNNTSYFVEAGKPLFTSEDDCDGRNLAEALGIEYAPLQHVLNADAVDYLQAVMMNQALYPATLGYFFESMLHPVLSEDDRAALRHFFVHHVTGRGPLPALRVGHQPYGVLLTSDFSKWQWQRREPFFSTAFLDKMHAVLAHYQSLWDSLLHELLYVGKPGKESSEVLMNVLGLQPGSVSFFQRTGYSTDYLKNLDAFQYGGRYAEDMAANFTGKNQVLSFLQGLGYDERDEAGFLKVPQALRLIYQHYHTQLDAANLVDPVPLSEKEIIRHYDAANKKNYLHWLAEAATIEALERQDFGADRKAPNALLYLQLRRALLLQLHKAAVHWFKNRAIPLDNALLSGNFYNIRPQGDLTKYEVLRAKVGVAAPDHPQKNIAIANHLLTTGRHEDEARLLNEMRESLRALAEVATAKLERCFTEHMDACTYRLDAWQTALFRLRLLKQRNVISRDTGAQRRLGIYLGAFGWLENIRPGSRLQVVTDEVPEKLRPPDNQPLYEYADNGGFVHAPSLNHASAAAVLRCGYLSHADGSNPNLMAVNLSSERVRRALFVLQGMRNGQTLEALLGYQFERGLHDRASADDALKKLNLYIYDFRDRFPHQQHYVKQQGAANTPVETIPASNVVNGVALAETTAAFPYGATGAVTSATPGERSAIELEKDKLADTLDAVKDLLLAESAYQMVQGNFDRSGAVLNALRDAHIPPELEVINTPRSSRLTFTNRVTIQFEHADPGLAENNPWDPIPMTPRARIEAGLNKWLGSLLGAPADIVYRAAHLDAEGNALGSSDMTVADLFLQPIDLVYIAGNELNTGAPEEGGEARTAASELETRIAYHYRQTHALDDGDTVRIEFLKPEIAGKQRLGVLLPLLRMLKSMLADSRHLHAEDFDPPSKKSLADASNPSGYDAANLQSRIADLASAFESCLDDLGNIAIQATVADQDGVPHTYSDLKSTFAAMEETKASFAEITFSLAGADAAQLQSVLMRLSAFGVPDAFPQLSSAFTSEAKTILLEQARSAARRAGVAHGAAAALMAEAAAAAEIENKVNKYLAAGKALLGEVFNILPLFTYNNEADIQQAHADRAQLLKYAREQLQMAFPAEEWLQNAAHVRPKLARWDYIRMLRESFPAGALPLLPVQLPYRARDSWLAVEFPETDEITLEPFNITHDTLSIVVHGEAAFAPAAKHCGLLIDDWTELIPGREEITGIAFNYNQPNACPPQTLLLAVTPQEKGRWTWEELVGILNDTLQRAKRRAVEPALLDKLDRPELSMLLPAMVADFSQYDLNICLDYRLNQQFYAQHIPMVTVPG